MRGIELLHPEMQAKAAEFIAECKKRGLPVQITDTFRTVAEQDALYAQGRTTPGNIVTNAKGTDYGSGHMFGVAFDVCRSDKENPYYNDKGKAANGFGNGDGMFAKFGAAGKAVGLQWGGDWKSPDKPHFELPKYMPNSSTATLKAKYGTPEAFKKTWGPLVAVPQNLTLANESGQIRVRYDKVSGAGGYQVTVSENENFTHGMGGSKTCEGYTKVTIKTCAGKPLVTGKTYYVRVRAYKLDGGKKVFGETSATVSLKFAKA